MIDIQHQIQMLERKIETIIWRRKKYGKVINAFVFLVSTLLTALLMVSGLEITIDQSTVVTLVMLISVSCGVGLLCIYNSMVSIKVRDYKSFISELREIEKKIGSTFNPRKH